MWDCVVDELRVLQAFVLDTVFLTPLDDEADSFFFRGFLFGVEGLLLLLLSVTSSEVAGVTESS